MQLRVQDTYKETTNDRQENKSDMIAWKKAELLCVGEIGLPESFPQLVSSAGPFAGRRTISLQIGNSRIKLPVGKNSEFWIQNSTIFHRGKIFLEDVKFLPQGHAPYQTFINLDSRCRYGCRFCVLPKLCLPSKNVKDALEIISKKPESRGIAITSGIPSSPSDTIKKIASLVKKVKRSGLPVGVEVYATRREDLLLLKRSGVDEIKLNLHSWDRRIFEKICPKMKYERILEMISHASDIFGYGKVCSNLLFGLGESDASILEGVEKLAGEGVAATLRLVRVNEYNRSELKPLLQRVKPERMLSLAREQKRIFKRYDLSPKKFQTMCHACGCCDLVPFVDL